MKKKYLQIAALAVLLGLTSPIAVAAPASAASAKDGNVSCSSFSFVKAKTMGATRHINPPGLGTVSAFGMNPNVYSVTYMQGAYRGGYWQVRSSGNVDTEFTIGYCQNYG